MSDLHFHCRVIQQSVSHMWTSFQAWIGLISHLRPTLTDPHPKDKVMVLVEYNGQTLLLCIKLLGRNLSTWESLPDDCSAWKSKITTGAHMLVPDEPQRLRENALRVRRERPPLPLQSHPTKCVPHVDELPGLDWPH